MKSKNANNNDTKKKSMLRRFCDSTAGVITFCILLFLSIHFLATPVIVVGDSMNPTYENGNITLSNRACYKIDEPKRFDVVVFNLNGSGNGLERITSGNAFYLIKRVIGLPGETIRIDEAGTIYIDGKALDENYGAETIKDPGRAIDEIVLGDDEYFVLGDNRNDSADSRLKEVGSVEKEQIVGKVVFSVPNLKVYTKGK